ncbi:MAG: tRNA guanosine(34) transglycosylase Tgt [candidate division Zixibacteria bacterium]|nr:tRNA guanosine(34) transglycosylase Tgt [candidate division Zixibacteria bacterium]
MCEFFSFHLSAESNRARAGKLLTPHGEIQTPVFMPVGTAASVKAVDADDLKTLGSQIILGNTYHLYLRPGAAVIREAGGLARFTGWMGPTLTDSGGFQVFSLRDLRRVAEEGVHFRSNIDGSPHLFTPESTIDIERDLGADIIMPLDVCVEYPTTHLEADRGERLTCRWAERARSHWENDKQKQALFGIIQGSVYPDLRSRAAESIMALDFPGHAIGGLSVGEPKAEMWPILDQLDTLLPPQKPRYLMGVGTPADIIRAIGYGIDMFDCVMPTRNARNGTVFTVDGRMIIKSARYTRDFRPLTEDCNCLCCQNYSRSYLRHLLNVGEIAGLRLLTIHNLHFYLTTVAAAREAIIADRFAEFSRGFLERYDEGEFDVA